MTKEQRHNQSGKRKARANERNGKLAFAFYSKYSRGSITRSGIKAENGKLISISFKLFDLAH